MAYRTFLVPLELPELEDNRKVTSLLLILVALMTLKHVMIFKLQVFRSWKEERSKLEFCHGPTGTMTLM